MSRSLGDSLGLRARAFAASPSIIDQIRDGGLPRYHLLGSGPDLDERVVMVVSLEDSMPQLAPRYYWRSLTYDQYNGRGWQTGETQTVRYREGEPVLEASSPNHRAPCVNVSR